MLLGLGGPKILWGGRGTGEGVGREGLLPPMLVGVGCGASELKVGRGREDGEPSELKPEYQNDEYLFKRFWDFIFIFFKDLMG